MKKIISIAFAATFFFSGCGNENADNPAATGEAAANITEVTIEKPGFQLRIPSTWREIPLQELPEKILTNSPQAVFQANNADSGVFTNVVVTEDTLPTSISTLEFSRQTVQNESVTLIGYQKYSEADVELSGQQTKLLEFEARPEASGKTLRYWQTFLTKEGKGFVFTAGIAPQANAATKETVLKILNSIDI